MTDHVRVGSKTKKARGGESVFAVPSPKKKAPRMTAVPPSAVSASPAVEAPAATNAASFPSPPSANPFDEFFASTTDSTVFNGCKFVSEGKPD